MQSNKKQKILPVVSAADRIFIFMLDRKSVFRISIAFAAMKFMNAIGLFRCIDLSRYLEGSGTISRTNSTPS